MGKTVKGSKGSGYEYWSREANGEGKRSSRLGKLSKKIKKRKLRRKNKVSDFNVGQ